VDEERDEARARLEQEYLAGSLSAEEYTQRRRELHEQGVRVDGREVERERAFASWGRRAAGLAIDSALLVVLVVVTIPVALAGSSALADLAAALLGFEILVLPFAYQWLMIGACGQTLGKMTVGVRVVRASDGSRFGYLVSLGRVASIWLLSIFTLPLLLAYLWPLWDARNQTLYDKMAGTVVVRTG
jgi:uncharacterized RDD family membrane protein YckC